MDAGAAEVEHPPEMGSDLYKDCMKGTKNCRMDIALGALMNMQSRMYGNDQEFLYRVAGAC